MKVLQPGRGGRGCDNEESNGVAHCEEVRLIIWLPATFWALLKHLSALRRVRIGLSSMNLRPRLISMVPDAQAVFALSAYARSMIPSDIKFLRRKERGFLVPFLNAKRFGWLKFALESTSRYVPRATYSTISRPHEFGSHLMA